ncbi:hypothetical protein SAMN04515619_11834 [Collimonas sp. OK412]|nr:hypothetical protein SAMN04515619_11834 [Collimonas sp. OK412]
MALAGCAHPIRIAPNIDNIKPSAAESPIKKSVAYYISDEMLAREIETPGGGGDRVAYSPYRDMETGFYKMLSNVFVTVTKLNTANDKASIEKNKIDYVITPKLVTNSSSSSVLTWMPTQFSVEMTCDISDANGNPLFSKKVNGQGQAEFSEFKEGFSLSGRRAMEDALLKMQPALLGAQELRASQE